MTSNVAGSVALRVAGAVAGKIVQLREMAGPGRSLLRVTASVIAELG